MTSNASRTELYRAFIGKRQAEYYLKRFQSFDEQGGGFYPSWNWAALLSFPFLFIAPLWAVYRGMYHIFWLWFFGVPVTLHLFLSLSSRETVSVMAVIFIVALVVGWFGFATYANAFYYKLAQRQIRQAQARQEEHDDVLSYLASKGGTHMRVLLVTLVLAFGVPSLLAILGVREYQSFARVTYVSEASSLAAPAKTIIETAYNNGYRLGDLPSQENLGMDPPTGYRGKYVRRVSVDKNGVITAQLTDDPRLGDARNGTVTWVPKVEGDRLVWTRPNCSFHPKWCPKR